jgi:hypothetical protein
MNNDRCHDMAQADARATGDFNHGVWWAKTAVEMAALRNLQMGKVSVRVRAHVCAGGRVPRRVPPHPPPPPRGHRAGGECGDPAETHEPRHCQHGLEGFESRV